MKQLGDPAAGFFEFLPSLFRRSSATANIHRQCYKARRNRLAFFTDVPLYFLNPLPFSFEGVKTGARLEPHVTESRIEEDEWVAGIFSSWKRVMAYERVLLQIEADLYPSYIIFYVRFIIS